MAGTYFSGLVLPYTGGSSAAAHSSIQLHQPAGPGTIQLSHLASVSSRMSGGGDRVAAVQGYGSYDPFFMRIVGFGIYGRIAEKLSGPDRMTPVQPMTVWIVCP